MSHAGPHARQLVFDDTLNHTRSVEDESFFLELRGQQTEVDEPDNVRAV